MTKKRKKKPDQWPMRPGDAPAPKTVDRAPCLAGMEDNVGFRLAGFYRRMRPSARTKATSISSWLLLIFLIFLCGPLGLILAVYYFFNPWASKGVSGKIEYAFMAPYKLMSALAHTTMSASDLVRGLWGASVGRRRTKMIGCACLAFFIFSLAMIAVLMHFNVNELFRLSLKSSLPLVLFITGFIFIQNLHGPWHVLPGRLARLKVARRSIELRVNPMQGALKILGRVGLRFILIFILIIGIGFLMHHLTSGSNVVDVSAFFNIMSRVPAIFWPAIFFASGGFVGIVRSLYLQKRTDRYIERMTREVDIILRWLSNQPLETKAGKK